MNFLREGTFMSGLVGISVIMTTYSPVPDSLSLSRVRLTLSTKSASPWMSKVYLLKLGFWRVIKSVSWELPP